MKLVGVKEFYNITRAKVVSAVNCAIVIAVCATATFAVDTSLDFTTVEAQPIETFAQNTEVIVTVVSYPDGFDPDNTDPTETEPEESAITSETSTDVTDNTSESSESSETSETSETSASSETSESTSSTTTETTAKATNTPKPTNTNTPTPTATPKPTEAITEKELYLAVYATTTINVRKGPGTDYDVVKNVFAGDQIDVIAVTSNGWYKTYNGNYVKKSLTTETKPTNTPTPKPKPTSKPTSSTTTAKPTSAPKPSGEGVSCKITFYGPQPTANGGYSKSTATGTTCTEGRTCAADWSIYPAGTVIYIENDPLGGDGYYTVEDRGGGVKGNHIDIYAEDGESGNHSTCYRTVYVK